MLIAILSDWTGVLSHSVALLAGALLLFIRRAIRKADAGDSSSSSTAATGTPAPVQLSVSHEEATAILEGASSRFSQAAATLKAAQDAHSLGVAAVIQIAAQEVGRMLEAAVMPMQGGEPLSSSAAAATLKVDRASSPSPAAAATETAGPVAGGGQ